MTSFFGESILGTQQMPCMRLFVPCEEDGSPVLWEEETIDYRLENVEIAFKSDKPAIGTGRLYITSKRVLWIGEVHAYDFDVAYIVLHGLTRDEKHFPKPCIYCQVNVEDLEDSDEEEVEETKDEGVTSPPTVFDEFFLIPSAETDLENIFRALSHAASINPDPCEDEEDDMMSNELIYNLEEVALGAEQARVLEHLDNILVVPEGMENDEDKDAAQFEDAES